MSKRLLQLALLVLISFTMLGAGTPSGRADKLGHSLVCQCGCGQILMECNHVGCPVSGPMITELQQQIASGLPDAGVLNFFVAKYGPIVLASPSRGGFDNAAWIVPAVVLLLGALLVIFILRRWKSSQPALAAQSQFDTPSTAAEDLRERIRRDTTYGE